MLCEEHIGIVTKGKFHCFQSQQKAAVVSNTEKIWTKFINPIKRSAAWRHGGMCDQSTHKFTISANRMDLLFWNSYGATRRHVFSLSPTPWTINILEDSLRSFCISFFFLFVFVQSLRHFYFLLVCRIKLNFLWRAFASLFAVCQQSHFEFKYAHLTNIFVLYLFLVSFILIQFGLQWLYGNCITQRINQSPNTDHSSIRWQTWKGRKREREWQEG